MWELILSAALLAANTGVRFETLDGRTESAQLIQLQGGKITVSIDGTSETIPFSDLLQVVAQEPSRIRAIEPTAWIELTDGSQIVAESFRESKGIATVSLAGGSLLELATGSVRWVRLRKAAPSLSEPWKSVVSREAKGDTVVIRQPGGTLDYLEGTLGEVSDENVRFTFDGDAVDVPRARLEGFVYYAPQGGELADVICEIVDTRGNRWRASSVQLSDSSLQLKTTADVELAIPIEYVQKLDFAMGNVVYLSDVEPMTTEWTSFLPPGAVTEQLSQLFQPRRDRSFSGGKLRLRFDGSPTKVKEFDKGLALQSRTEVIYRLPEGFRRLTAIAGIDERVREAGSVSLDISGDGRTLLTQTITGKDAPVPIDIEIAGVRRLRILVDYADDLSIADQLELCNLRITK